jgi:hypothetical protein
MGYQVVTIELRDGRKFENVTVVGGAVSGLPPGVEQTFTDADIDQIVVTHGEPGAG